MPYAKHNTSLISSHKLNFHLKEVSQWLKGQARTSPIYVEISPTSRCNHRCVFCALDFTGHKTISLDTRKLINTLGTMKDMGVKSIMLAGEGEPLLHKDIVSIIERAYFIGLDIGLTTNGVLLDSSKLMILRYCKWIKFSIDAGHEDVYSKIHGCSGRDWSVLWTNISNAVKYRDMHSLDCTLGGQAVALAESIHTLPRLESLCKGTGLDYLVIKQYSKHSLSINSLKPVNPPDLSTIHFSPYVIIRPLAVPRTYDRCHSTPTFWAYVDSSGEVYGCSDKLGLAEFKYGNINKKSFSSIWNGKVRRSALNYMKAYDTSQCRLDCRMDACNRYLEEMRNPPSHVNFI